MNNHLPYVKHLFVKRLYLILYIVLSGEFLLTIFTILHLVIPKKKKKKNILPQKNLKKYVIKSNYESKQKELKTHVTRRRS